MLRRTGLDRRTEAPQLPGFELLVPKNKGYFQSLYIRTLLFFKKVVRVVRGVKMGSLFDLVVYLASSFRSNLIKVWFTPSVYCIITKLFLVFFFSLCVYGCVVVECGSVIATT